MDVPDKTDPDPDAALRSQLAEAVATEAAFSGWSDTGDAGRCPPDRRAGR